MWLVESSAYPYRVRTEARRFPPVPIAAHPAGGFQVIDDGLGQQQPLAPLPLQTKKHVGMFGRALVFRIAAVAPLAVPKLRVTDGAVPVAVVYRCDPSRSDGRSMRK